MDAFQAIASELVAACPPSFTRAWLTAEVDDDHSSVQYWCDVAGKVEQPEMSAAAAFEIGDALVALKRTPPFDAADWRRCTFTVVADGAFDFRIEYDA